MSFPISSVCSAADSTATSVRPGDRLGVEVEWWFADGETTPAHVSQCLHFLQDGRIAFQLDLPFRVELAGVEDDGRMRYVSRFAVTVPEGVSGTVVPAFGLYRPGVRSRRLAPETERATDRRRILLEPIEIAAAP